MTRLYWYHVVFNKGTEEFVIAELVLRGIKVLAYLESRE